MSDFEKQRLIEEQNRLLEESNRLQQEKILADERQQQREYEEEIERGFQDKIFNLRTLMAQTSDPNQEAKLQALLSEAITERENYYREKEQNAIREGDQEQLRMIIFATIILLLISGFLFFNVWKRNQSFIAPVKVERKDQTESALGQSNQKNISSYPLSPSSSVGVTSSSSSSAFTDSSHSASSPSSPSHSQSESTRTSSTQTEPATSSESSQSSDPSLGLIDRSEQAKQLLTSFFLDYQIEQGRQYQAITGEAALLQQSMIALATSSGVAEVVSWGEQGDGHDVNVLATYESKDNKGPDGLYYAFVVHNGEAKVLVNHTKVHKEVNQTYPYFEISQDNLLLAEFKKIYDLP